MMFILDYLISYKTHINILGYSLFQGSIFSFVKLELCLQEVLKGFVKVIQSHG